MRNYINNKLIIFNLKCCLTLFFIFVMAACGGGGSSNSSSPAQSNATATPTLQSISVTPNLSSMAAGLTLQYTATGNYSDGTSQVIQSPSWNSSAPSVATISATGLITSTQAGSSTITASANGMNGSTTLTVTAATLQSITVTSSSSSVAAGLTVQFIATGQYSDGTSQVIQSPTWSSSLIANATISSTGLATTLLPGNTVITASSNGVTGSSNGVSGSVHLTITAAILQSIAVTASSISIPLTFTEQFLAKGHYSDGSTQELPSAIWSSSTNTVATVSSTGMVTSTQSGSTTISALANGITGSLAISVSTATPSSISIVENYGTSSYLPQASIPTTLYLGSVIQLTPLVLYTDGSSMILSLPVSNTSVGSVATIGPTGVLTPVAPGTAVVSVSFSGFTTSITFTVSSATLTSIAISPSSFSISPSSTQTLTATATYSDSTSQVIQEQAVQPIIWSSSANNVVTVSQGVVNWISAGNAVITATFGGKSGTASVTSTP
ncbi:Ig-like domain-containing protein [Solimicrobium silvestre]|uniref:Bacterial Ig-like domain (Group 2) n=1 Tax=Solimicrobium silvestre TaxID=2099400 RepID=A0A2S9GVN7_9BURK|nr:Ig-like domain-containing protein [Solimicrobium silvestre]PRC91782.1 Bacterial Ig-like domain (group 2) [Solimicrobium silvestre]